MPKVSNTFDKFKTSSEVSKLVVVSKGHGRGRDFMSTVCGVMRLILLCNRNRKESDELFL